MCPYSSYCRVGELLLSFESGSSYSPKLVIQLQRITFFFGLQLITYLVLQPVQGFREYAI